MAEKLDIQMRNIFLYCYETKGHYISIMIQNLKFETKPRNLADFLHAFLLAKGRG